MLKSIKEIKEFFYNQHDVVCNQKFDGTLPYSYHLDLVEKQAWFFRDLIGLTHYPLALAGCYGHDSIEDARVTYKDIEKRFGTELAEIIYLCTENKGRTRDERKSVEFYQELRQNSIAVFVKLCDLVANVKYSLLTNSSMYDKYRKEYVEKIKPILYIKAYKPIFDDLDWLLQVT